MPTAPAPAALAGFPYREVAFTKAGRARVGAAERVEDLPPTDVLVLAHGWNETATSSRDLYGTILTQVRTAFGEGRRPTLARTVSVVGLQWPSMILTDDVALSTDRLRASIAAALPRRYEPVIDELCQLLRDRPSRDADVSRFMALLGELGGAVPGSRRDEDGDNAIVASADPMFDLQALVDPPTAAGLGDVFGRVWRGAQVALRATTFWQMKRRAGTTGALGLGVILAELAAKRPDLRVHLVGHSFGARLIASVLPGLNSATSTVASMTLLQGAFSHFAFAPSLPHELGRAGQLSGLEGQVRGPIVATHTRFDTALSSLYPLAARMSGDDAADEDRVARFGALGADGAQGSPADATTLLAPGGSYTFRPSRVTNVDANAVMNRGGPPDGAHSDLAHREIGWLIACATGLRRPADE